MPEEKTKTYVVQVILKYVVQARSPEEAEQIAWDSSYSEAVDCYIGDVEEQD